MAGDALRLTVKDSDPLKWDDCLGCALLTADQVRSGFVGELALEGAGDGVEAFLHVRVDPVDPTFLEKVEFVAEELVDAVEEKFGEVMESITGAKAAKEQEEIEQAQAEFQQAQAVFEDFEDRVVLCGMNFLNVRFPALAALVVTVTNTCS